jgi:hypothetical protein
MVKLVATHKAYALGRIIEAGETFGYPDALWNDPERRPSWAKLAAFGGKGDHDGDGKVGGSVPAKPAAPKADAVVVPADWQNGSAAERKELARLISGERVPNKDAADVIIAAYVEANKAAPFADAPAPEVIEPGKGNGLQEALGATRPDWVAPDGTPQPVAD